MRILVVSDLHLEFWGRRSPLNQGLKEIEPVDVVVLAGDIYIGSLGVTWAAKTFPDTPVFYVMGNHESYGAAIEETIEIIESECILHSKVQFMNRREIIFNGVRFLGATLWTDFKLFGDENAEDAMDEVQEMIMDYRRIKVRGNGYESLTTLETREFHEAEKAWLCKKLDEPFDGKTIVITHMAPSMKSVAERYKSDLVSAAFASNLDAIVEKADFWIHGHMHDSFDYMIGKCRVICNPCGYPKSNGRSENGLFDPILVLKTKI